MKILANMDTREWMPWDDDEAKKLASLLEHRWQLCRLVLLDEDRDPHAETGSEDPPLELLCRLCLLGDEDVEQLAAAVEALVGEDDDEELTTSVEGDIAILATDLVVAAPHVDSDLVRRWCFSRVKTED